MLDSSAEYANSELQPRTKCSSSPRTSLRCSHSPSAPLSLMIPDNEGHMSNTTWSELHVSHQPRLA